MAKKNALVLCAGNSARSQMGEGLFRAEDGGGFEVFSAVKAFFRYLAAADVSGEILDGLGFKCSAPSELAIFPD